MPQDYEEKVNKQLANYQKKLDSLKKQRKELNNKTSQIKAKIKDARQRYEIKKLQEIAPIAFAAQDVFKNSIPNNREKARVLFQNMLSDALKWREEHPSNQVNDREGEQVNDPQNQPPGFPNGDNALDSNDEQN